MKMTKPSVTNLSRFSIIFFIFLIIFLPSGNIGSFNIKMLSMALMLLVTLIFVVNNKKLRVQSVAILGTVILMLFFVFLNYMNATTVALVRGYSSTEAILFLSYFISTAVLFIVIIEGLISKEAVVKAIIYSCLYYSLVKIIITLLSVVGVISINSVSQVIYATYGIKPMLFPITERLSRFQLANDYIVCFTLFFLMVKRSDVYFISKKVLNIISIVLIISVLISFSRYMMLLIIIAMLIKLFSIKKVSGKGVFFIFFSVIFLMIVYFLNMNDVNDAIALRFSSEDNNVSDATRQFQINCLSAAFEDKPLLGHGGLGDFSQNCPGPRDAEFSYEVQYLGFLYRFGIIQTILLIILFISQFFIAMQSSVFERRNLPSLLAVACWLLIGFFNPYLVSGYASVIMTLSLCFTYQRIR
ncbi:TPA: hypothetical protein NHT93_003035 [Klebsiella oxytoca]|uniref:O-antigen ligase family protein n=1 Tax=Klebsiella oxytoca TaxID=571 RepID=UPI001158317E|nr:O-antigen ligase family protein [Klebsiella oxytoca]EKH6432560.1 hypothetical protein [Klebsiella oxytoca]EKJ7586994.1 hypothetical protein [Klebsiella oxytoca]MBZ7635600.1 hypothetical protein [Klebsiella oxytoca]HCE8845932.1 hypothetical protein [Klebsiella oxytoca]HCH7901223.1 hypothetical protein [Klebsiella oxytoca]